MDRSPILILAFFCLLGCSVALIPHWIYIFPLLALLYLTKQKVLCLAIFVGAVGWALFRHPTFGADELEGKGTFILEKIQPTQSPFERSLAIKGKFSSFKAKDRVYFNLPCVIFQKTPPPNAKSWDLEGKINRGMFKLKKKSEWKIKDPSFCFARFRYENKERVRRYFQDRFSDPRVNHFFASMATGDINDRLLAMEFRKLGLGHILAISGFHFALVAGMLGSFFRLLLRPTLSYALLLFCLSLYFLFLGSSPSIFRAFTMISLFILGRLLQRRVDVLNLLGAALLLELVIDPACLTEVGFQLSFLATYGILAFYQLFNRGLEKLLPKRSFEEAKKLSFVDKHGHLFIHTLRQGLALNLSVHLVTMPVVLYTFRMFPLLSIPYNLLFPPLLSISLLLIPLGVLLPPLAHLNAKYTSFLLNLIANPPEILNGKLFIQAFSFPLLIVLLSVMGILGLTLCPKQDKNMGCFHGDRSSVG